MGLLDRYILRQYLTNVVALFAILFGFVITVDVSLNIARYVKVAERLIQAGGDQATGLRTAGVCIAIIADLWGPRLLLLFNFMVGLIMVGAMGFTIGQLSRRRELVAILAAGRGLLRTAAPILFAALVLTALQAANQEYMLPRLAPRLSRDQGEVGFTRADPLRVPLTADGTGRVFYARAFDAETGRLTDLHVWERDQAGKPLRRLRAASAHWDGAAWVLDNPFHEPRADSSPNSQPEHITVAADRLPSDLSPTLLRMRQNAAFSQNLAAATLAEMAAAVRRLEADERRSGDGPAAAKLQQTRAQLDRLRFGRIATMLSNLLSLLVALPFFLVREPRSLVAQSLRCAPVALVTLIGGVIGATAPVPGIPPHVAVFIPAMILAPLAVAALFSIRS